MWPEDGETPEYEFEMVIIHLPKNIYLHLTLSVWGPHHYLVLFPHLLT